MQTEIKFRRGTFADPERKLGGAYVMNKQGVALMGDPRPKRLIAAAYG